METESSIVQETNLCSVGEGFENKGGPPPEELMRINDANNEASVGNEAEDGGVSCCKCISISDKKKDGGAREEEEDNHVKEPIEHFGLDRPITGNGVNTDGMRDHESETGPETSNPSSCSFPPGFGPCADGTYVHRECDHSTGDEIIADDNKGSPYQSEDDIEVSSEEGVGTADLIPQTRRKTKARREGDGACVRKKSTKLLCSFGASSGKIIKAVLVDGEWLEACKDFALRGLPRALSDHCLLLVYSEMIDWGPKPFRTLDA
ncbi:hypothetical protein PIB30_043915 [Stylosanthes scabra]|uniref:Uncharacterized protein n=1 Tax=Stylosanthes scabra TaxID=79078 RepID=A0ABU6UFY1_9FABA|nr:hypothetical protein [Stylosanthes scabra]